MKFWVLVFSCAGRLWGSADAQTFSDPENFGNVNSPIVNQASGLAIGMRDARVVWTHNDQTDGRLFALATNGVLLAAFSLNYPVQDLEDVAVVPGMGGSAPMIYAGDLGNNFGGRETVQVLRAPEPIVDLVWSSAPRTSSLTSSLSGVEVFTLRYPDGRHNAEPLIVDHLAGRLFILTKASGNARIYSVELAALSAGKTNVLRFEGEIAFPQLTAGTISADGRMIALRSATKAKLWTRAIGESVPDALRRPGVSIPVIGLPEEPNGEGITFATDNSGYFTISEGSHQPLHFVRNAAAVQIAKDEATIVVRYFRGRLEESLDLRAWREVHAGGGEYRPGGNEWVRFYRVVAP